MATSYGIAPQPLWRFRDTDGNLAVNGTVTFYKNSDRSTKKAVYQDAAGSVEWSNPIYLNQNGEAPGLIYFADDETYYLEIRDSDGLLFETFQNFPTVIGGSGGGGTTTIEDENLFINGQFRFFDQSKYTNPTDLDFKLAEFWRYERNNNNADVTLEMRRFALGANPVQEGSPIYYLRYDSATGSSQTKNDLVFKLKDVRTLEQTDITIQAQARRNSGSGDIDVIVEQNFGTGGSPSSAVETNAGTFSLTSSWGKKSISGFTVPSLSGKTRGTNDDDFVAIRFRFPLNQDAEIDLTNLCLNIGKTVIEYPRLSWSEENALIVGSEIPQIDSEDDEDKSIVVESDLTYGLELAVPAGVVLPYAGTSAPTGYLACDGSTVKAANDKLNKRLFDVIGHKFGYGIDAFIGIDNSDNIHIIHSTNATGTAPDLTGITNFSLTTDLAGDSGTVFWPELFPDPNYDQPNTVIWPSAKDNPTALAKSGLSNLTTATLRQGTPNTSNVYRVQFDTNVSPSAGDHFDIANGSTVHKFWYEVDGSGSAPSGTTHKVAVSSSDDNVAIAGKTLNVLGGFRFATIQTDSAGNITPGEYFELTNAGGSTFYFWYEINGTGTDPDLSGKEGVKVAIDSGDSAATVANKTATEIRNVYYQVPWLAGSFLRFATESSAHSKFDKFLNPEDSLNSVGHDIAGNLEFDDLHQHTHDADARNFQDGTTDKTNTNIKGAVLSDWTGTEYGNQNFHSASPNLGGYETRPVNYTFNAIIKR